MVAIKAHQSEKFINAPPENCAAYLLYGNDAGLVSERAIDLANLLAKRQDPPGEIIQILDQDLEDSPDRFLIELQTQPMFGGQKIVRSILSRRINTNLIKPIIEPGPTPGRVILETGNLKPTDAIRKLFEKLPHAAAIACYRDESRDLERLIDQELKQAGLKIGRDAKALLATRLGADRALSRSEIQKLAIYCLEKKEITSEDVEAIVGDASELALDHVIYAMARGDPKSAIAAFSRAINSGQNPQGILSAAQRHFDRLHRARAAVDKGSSSTDTIRALRPPVHFRQKDAFAAQTRRWSIPTLQKARSAIAESIIRARTHPSLEAAITERVLLQLCRLPDR